LNFQIDTPRYGILVGFSTTKNLKAGEEILSDYDYPKHEYQGDGPGLIGREWYKNEWLAYLEGQK
jgi:hypothetical protein